MYDGKIIQTWAIPGPLRDEDYTWLLKTFKNEKVEIDLPRPETIDIDIGKSFRSFQTIETNLRINTTTQEQVVWLKLYFGSNIHLLNTIVCYTRINTTST